MKAKEKLGGACLKAETDPHQNKTKRKGSKFIKQSLEDYAVFVHHHHRVSFCEFACFRCKADNKPCHVSADVAAPPT